MCVCVYIERQTDRDKDREIERQRDEKRDIETEGPLPGRGESYQQG